MAIILGFIALFVFVMWKIYRDNTSTKPPMTLEDVRGIKNTKTQK